MGFFSLPPKGVYPTLEALGDIMELEVVQWGNTQNTSGTPTCQHGAMECHVMTVYACDKYTAATPMDHANFVECFDKALMAAFPKGLPEPTPVNKTWADAAFSTCAAANKQDWKKLEACAAGDDGLQYFLQEGAKTPSHHAVPFVSINGGPIIYNSATLNLKDEVCKAYTGTKPKACTDVTVGDSAAAASPYASQLLSPMPPAVEEA